MPHWLALTLTIAGSVTTLVAFVVALRKVKAAVIDVLGRVERWADKIATASTGFDKLTMEVRALAGAVVNLCTQILRRQDDHEDRLKDLGELYVDLVATVARNRKRIEHLEVTDGAHHDPPAD